MLDWVVSKFLAYPPVLLTPPVYMNVLTTPFETYIGSPVASPCGRKIPSSLRIEFPSCDFLPSDVSTVVLSAKWFSSWWLNQPIGKICASQIGSLPQVGMKIKNIKKYKIENLRDKNFVGKKWWTMGWVVPLPTNSRHKDSYKYIFSSESL